MDPKSRIDAVLAHGQFVNGPEVRELEKAMAAYVGVGHAVGCNSGTDALVLALKVAGVGPGDKVIVPAFTFQATAAAVVLAGATPVFADVDEGFGIDPETVTCKAKAIIAVDMFGVPADWGKVHAFSKENKLIMIEDAAQAIGSEYKEKKCGSLADIGCTSFYPSKPLAGIGDGGMVFLKDGILAQDVRKMANHGRSPAMNPFNAIVAGMNSRLDTIQAAVLLERLEQFENELASRRAQARFYAGHFGGEFLPWCAWSWYPFLYESEKMRDNALSEFGQYGAKAIYPKPLNRMPAFAASAVECPVAESFCRRILAFPVKHHWETNECIRHIRG